MRFPLFLCLVIGVRLAIAEPIDTVARIRALAPTEAARGLPVRIEGIVTYFDSKANDLFLQDATAGTYVGNCLWLKSFPNVAPGDRVRVEGWTCRGGFFPDMIVAQGNEAETGSAAPRHAFGSIQMVKKGAGLPVPRRLIDRDDVLAPEFDSQWVEVSAVVTGVESGGLAFTLAIEVNGWKLKAEIPRDDRSAERAEALMQRSVRIRGVAGTVFNTEQQMTGRFLYVPSFDFITPDDSHPADSPPPLRAVNELLRKDDSIHSKVRIQGVVTQVAKNGFYMRDSHDSVMVLTARRGAFFPGDRLEVEGCAAIAPFRPVLKATRVVVLGRSESPKPLALVFDQPKFPLFHTELVTVDAHFLARRDDPIQIILQCQTGSWVFEAALPLRAALAERLTAGDRLRLTGICELTTTHPTPRIGWVDGFRLHLPEAGGIEILRRAPWWTLRHLMFALGVLGAVAFGALAWVWILRRTVREQTETIASQLKREGVLEERQRIARELHDTVEQGLTGLWMQLGTIARDFQNAPEEATSEIRFAQQMLRHCREEARTSIRDLRNIELEQMGLPGALEMLLPSLGSSERVAIHFKISGNAQPIGAIVENHVLRIAQEAVSNATHHASPQSVNVSLAYAPASVMLEIRDDGCGFDPSAPAPQGHFGLVGMRERADKIQAKFTIESAQGTGTIIRVSIPYPHEK